MNKPKKSILRFYVYALLDPRKPGNYKYGRLRFKYKPFYIGKGQGERYNSHSNEAKKYLECKVRSVHNLKKVVQLKKIFKEGFEPIVRIIRKDLLESEAFAAERRYIKWIGRRDKKTGPLLNQSSGGAGTSGRIECSETKQRRVQTFQATVAGMPADKLESWYDNISKAAKRRTPRQKAKLGKRYSEIQRNLPKTQKAEMAKKQSIAKSKMWESYTEKQYAEHCAKYSEGHKRRYATMSAKERREHCASIKQGYALKPKHEIEEKNAKISDAIKKQHATMSLYDRRIRSFMLMASGLMSIHKVKDEDLKVKLKEKARKFYSDSKNLTVEPKRLRDKVRTLILAVA